MGNIGGGLAIDYSHQNKAPSPRSLKEAVAGEAEFQLMLEPGRSLVASACILLTSVLGTKEGKEGRGRKYAVVDAAMTELLRPALYAAEHLVIPVKERDEGEEMTEYDVVGP